MQPSVVHDGTTYFWQLPSANTLARGDGWRWEGFGWGWRGANVANASFDGGWCFDPASDPSLTSPILELDASTVGAVEVTLSTEADNQTTQLFFGGADGALADEKSVQWAVEGDGAPRTYTIPLRDAPGWNGTITTLRLDPIAVGDGTAASRTCVQQLRFVR
jgi:hypothetical protein